MKSNNLCLSLQNFPSPSFDPSPPGQRLHEAVRRPSVSSGMASKDILKLLAGFRRFRHRYFEQETKLFHRLSQGQSPKTLIIGCSDSRVDPALISSASPGELFVIRNVANLVPPYDDSGGIHGVSAAIEFAVVHLKVENILILGHRQCGGIRSLMLNPAAMSTGFIGRWMQIAEEAKQRVLAQHPGADDDTLCRQCEKESILTSLKNLRSFPFVKEAIEDRKLNLLGIYFDLESGQLLECDEALGQFHEIGPAIKSTL